MKNTAALQRRLALPRMTFPDGVSCHPTRSVVRKPAASPRKFWPSGYGVGLLSRWGFPRGFESHRCRLCNACWKNYLAATIVRCTSNLALNLKMDILQIEPGPLSRMFGQVDTDNPCVHSQQARRRDALEAKKALQLSHSATGHGSTNR